MAAPLRRYYWCSCSWLALIQDETVLVGGKRENRGALCRAVVADAAKGGAEIYTSALTFVEVCKPVVSGSPIGEDVLRSFFENDYIVIVALDRQVGEVGRTLMRNGLSGLKPPDAAHLAAAIVACVDEMHTFDAALLALNGKLDKADGTKLRICKPSMGGPQLPLLENIGEKDE